MQLTSLIFLVTLLAWQTIGSAYALDADEVIKYFNPIHEKSYVNQSQDRVIKKNSYKASSLKGVKPVANRELGIFATVDNPADLANLKTLLRLPDVNGLSCIFSWKQLEPAKDKFDWQAVDQVLSLCAQENKYLILRVSTCGLDESATQSDTKSSAIDNSDTPRWVFDEGVKYLSYTGHDNKERAMPIFWDNTYLAQWSNFVHAMGNRYDKNPYLHSVGITGGGFLGGTTITPNFQNNKQATEKFTESLKTNFNMTPRQLVQHWKYAADLFPLSFPTARLGFDIDPPLVNRAGQDELDEISDYLIYRYGERIYLIRQNVIDAKHGFDQYRVMLKFKADTLAGDQLGANISPTCLAKLDKNMLDDGISFAEIPSVLLLSNDKTVIQFLSDLNAHLGYQIVAQSAKVPSELKQGDNLSASFQFVNIGDHVPIRPLRQLDKDVAASFRIQLELRDQSGKTAVASLHTPPTPTTGWLPGKSIAWNEDLKLGKIKPGDYSVWISVVDDQNKRKLNVLDALSEKEPIVQSDLFVSNLHISE